jgi:hypothetical protein
MKFHILIFLLMAVSCTQQPVKKNNDMSDVPTDVKEDVKDRKYVKGKDFWAKEYYHSTTLVLNQPSIREAEDDIWKVCHGKTLLTTRGYHQDVKDKIEYLATPLTIETRSGFVKKVHVTKGMCRELGLYKNQASKKRNKKDKHQLFRKILARATIEYIYTKRAYVKELIFATSFKDVNYFVR